MKKMTFILFSVLLIFSLSACGNSSQNRSENTPAVDRAPVQTAGLTDNSGESTEQNAEAGTGAGDATGAVNGKILVAYFSVMETDGVDTVGGDLFPIETIQEYPTTHEPLLDFAYEEKADNARPELAAHIEDPDSYDVIFLGFPNWNADLPMPLYTFLEEYNFSGKTIIPFTTHGGSGFSRTIQTIAELQPDAEVISDGLSISRNSVSGAESEVIDWVNGLGLNN